MTDEIQLAAWCDAMAALLDLPIEHGDRVEIIANLRIIARQMKLVDEIALDNLAEPAPVFRA
jgi:hypothetical protein